VTLWGGVTGPAEAMILVLAAVLLLGGWGSTLARFTAAVWSARRRPLVGACVEVRPDDLGDPLGTASVDDGVDQTVRAVGGEVAFGESGEGLCSAEEWHRDRGC
jgi:hypothetical protein